MIFQRRFLSRDLLSELPNPPPEEPFIPPPKLLIALFFVYCCLFQMAKAKKPMPTIIMLKRVRKIHIRWHLKVGEIKPPGGGRFVWGSWWSEFEYSNCLVERDTKFRVDRLSVKDHQVTCLQTGFFNVENEACVWTTQGMLWESMYQERLRGLHQSNLVWCV